MTRSVLAGTRIRDRRNLAGMRQVELAKACGISASYLNLIEHNRRRIGGALLLKIARALNAEPSELGEGGEATLVVALGAAAGRHSDARAENDRIEELTSRFPGWARVIDAQLQEARRLEQVVERLEDRLAHDPFLSASMHDVLTSVTAIRSSSAILASGEQIEPEWQARFHRNIYEDSQRLARATESLVGYLNDEENQGRERFLPQEQLEHWLAARDWHFPALEPGRDGTVEDVLEASASLGENVVRDLARRFLEQYIRDAEHVPMDRLREVLTESRNPALLASILEAPLPIVMRRLASLPTDDLPGDAPFGLVSCDGSGSITFRKPLPGFDLPRSSGGCSIWPLFRALQQPLFPLQETLRLGTRDVADFDVTAIAELSHPKGYNAPAVLRSWMLIQEVPLGQTRDVVLQVGRTCGICSVPECPARRESSVFV